MGHSATNEYKLYVRSRPEYWYESVQGVRTALNAEEAVTMHCIEQSLTHGEFLVRSLRCGSIIPLIVRPTASFIIERT